ncbi:hypothetical protein TD95_000022 [Thielaviopsis punctulata]|uniref:AMP-dependent synthetase/ligase domain-containing protein n=1 Tax=Thielaviopsis punctulata TaxID=72032 RepID=A0A0F4Z7G9_9PEZI|nr:hypothetical protein TD95_000022 [Thielaviopsis punctulata]
MSYLTGMAPLKQVGKPPYTIEVPGPAVDGETLPRRHPKAKDGLIRSPAEGVFTIYDLVERSSKLFPKNKILGSRQLIKMHKEIKKVPKVIDGQVTQVDKEWQYFELSPYSYITYEQHQKRYKEIGAGFRKLGANPGDKVHLFAATSANWLTIAHACSSQSMSIVTAYDSLGASGVEHTLVQSAPEIMYVDPHLLKVASGALEKATSVKTIIYNESCVFAVGGEVEQFKASHPNMKVLSLEEVRKLGEENPVETVPPKPNQLFCLMYTSGSTGVPKGVPVTHEAATASVAGLYSCIEGSVTSNDTILAYLPLAHIFELILENLVISIGACMGYGSPRTLSDTMTRNSAGDMREFAPTILVGVPQIWETVRKGVTSKVEQSSPLIRSLFWGAIGFKTWMTNHNMPGASLLDSVVFSKVRQMTGGRLRFIVNGASGISDSTKHFLSIVLAPMMAGYGLTETAAIGSLGSPLQYSPDAIGPVPASVEVKLVSIPELGYFTNTTPPQGEIYIRGYSVIKEYYQNPEETAKVLTADGWFKTGDIGEFNSVGHVKVIDRVKNLVKLAGGEYIALEKLESIYRGSQLVANIMIHGDSEHSRAIAVVMPNEVNMKAKAKDLGISDDHIYSNEKLRSATLKDLQAVGRRTGLSSLEMVAGVVICDEEWTPVNGMVTATQKINRRAIKAKYSNEIAACFKAL